MYLAAVSTGNRRYVSRLAAVEHARRVVLRWSCAETPVRGYAGIFNTTTRGCSSRGAFNRAAGIFGGVGVSIDGLGAGADTVS